ncbi:hypothetical protein BC937DRAFT_92645 [Endogone sp. FLAS-F59071]|nr:hypothetical protein BC937DRAFT_92645 [Endogone sp. FLAS-F59071]|eukprot:RUS23077.1 hypothetical protein BC937DRAFT_92645 [Endogone sp. FLAS-F59071]
MFFSGIYLLYQILESMRPVIVSKGALSTLVRLIESYIKSCAIPLHAEMPASAINSDSRPSSNLIKSTDEATVAVLLNNAHIIYQLTRAGILSRTQLFSEGTFDALIQLSSLELNQVTIKKNLSNEENEDAAAEAELQQRIRIIQGVAAKAISGIAANAANQHSIIESVKRSHWLTRLLSSPNPEVCKYAAKTMAYLSLRNDKHKSSLIQGDGAKALVALIVASPGDNADINREDGVHKEQQGILASIFTVSHACCALENVQ